MDIRVVLFDDNEKRRDSLQMLIELMDNMECVGVFPDCRHVLKNMEDTEPHVVLMDIDMPFVNGIEGVCSLVVVSAAFSGNVHEAS
jgi:DNA-binding NarL/FixJ family response regulator